MNDREGARIAEIMDGTSNTLMVSEDANRPQLWVMGRQRTDIIAQTSNYPAGIVGLGRSPEESGLSTRRRSRSAVPARTGR